MSRPFDLEAAKAGAPVKTRCGQSARLFCFDLKSSRFPIVGAIELIGLPRIEEVASWTENGNYAPENGEHDFDLVMAPRKVVKWIAIHSDNQGVNWAYSTTLYDSEEEVRATGFTGVVARVEWEK